MSEEGEITISGVDFGMVGEAGRSHAAVSSEVRRLRFRTAAVGASSSSSST